MLGPYRDVSLSALCRCGVQWHAKATVSADAPAVTLDNLSWAECPVCKVTDEGNK